MSVLPGSPIRAAQSDDAHRLGEIHVFGWRYAYRGIVPDRELFVDRNVGRSVEMWTQRLQGECGTLVFDDGLVKGFVIQGAARDDDAAGCHEVMAIYVEPPFVREGVGSRLLAAAEERAAAEGRRLMKIWVLEANPRARAFYERNGYRPDGTSKVIPEWNGALELRYSKDL